MPGDDADPRGGARRHRGAQRTRRARGAAAPSTSFTACASGMPARDPGSAGNGSAASSRSSTGCFAAPATPASPPTSATPELLAGVRYVITLDSDTRLPRNAARQLIGIIAHPLNRPHFDRAPPARHRGLRHPAAARERHDGERGRVALRPGVLRSHRRRSVHHRGLGHVPGPLQRGHLRRQGPLRRRRVRGGTRGTRAGERPPLARPLRGTARAAGARHRRRGGGRLPRERAHPRAAPAPLGPRRLADPLLALPAGADAPGPRAQHAAADLALEDLRQPAAHAGGAGHPASRWSPAGWCCRASRGCGPPRSSAASPSRVYPHLLRFSVGRDPQQPLRVFLRILREDVQTAARAGAPAADLPGLPRVRDGARHRPDADAPALHPAAAARVGDRGGRGGPRRRTQRPERRPALHRRDGGEPADRARGAGPGGRRAARRAAGRRAHPGARGSWRPSSPRG